MVLPLKLTQFYGTHVPRPRIYPDVNFSSQRVDPPPSAHDALLHWAHQAHWSMGGLSFQRVRMQGKIEGSVRRLRAQKEKEARRKKSSEKLQQEPESVSDSDESDLKENAVRADPSPTPKKRKRNLYEATPSSVRQRRSEKEVDSPKFVPATEDRKGATSVAGRRTTRSVGDANLLSTTPASKTKKPDLRRSSRSVSVSDSPGFVPATHERKRSITESPLSTSIEDAATVSPDVTPLSAKTKRSARKPPNEVVRSTPAARKIPISASPHSTSIEDTATLSPDVTPLSAKSKRSAKKFSTEVVRSTPAARKIPMRKLLVQDDSSDSDAPVQSSPRHKMQPLRKSARLGLATRVEKQASSSTSSSDSE